MRQTLLFGLLGIALFLLAHPPMLGVGEQALFPGWDATRVFWADLEFFRRSLTFGELPLWNPYDRAGYPFVAEPQSGVFDPVVLALVGLALAMGTAPAWLIVAKAVIYYGIAASGIAAFLRGRGLPAWATSLGVAVFVLCPRMDKLKDQSALWPIAWGGWLLWAIDRCAARPSWRRGAGLGAIASMVVLSGYPPMAFRIALAAVPYAVIAAVTATLRAGDRRAHLRGLASACGGAALVLVGLCAAQIWSTVQVLPDTQRAALDLREVYAGAMPVSAAVGLLAPFPRLPELGVYFGFVAVPGLVLALRSSAADRWLWLSAALGIVLACGPNTPLLPALTQLPGFGAFRIPGHYLGVPALAVASLAALGAASLVGGSRRVAWFGAAAAGLGFGLAVSTMPARDPLTVALAAATAGLFAALGFVSGGRARWVGWALAAVACADLMAANEPVAKILQPLPDRTRGEVLARRMAGDGEHRVADFEWARNRIGPRHGLRDLTGHRPALTDTRYLMLYHAAPDSSALLQATGVALVGMKKPGKAARSPALSRVAGQRNLFAVADPWPLAFWTGTVKLEPSSAAVLERLRGATGPRAVLERADAGGRVAGLEALRDPSPPVPARIERYTPNSITMTVEAPAPGVVVVGESYGAGWRAWVDGVESPVLRGNLIQRVIEVPAGVHAIELRYQPRGVVALWGLWLATAVGLVVIAARSIRVSSRDERLS